MRLIDADELKKHKYHNTKTCENAVAVAQIDWMPTVDAVPMSVIEDIKAELISLWGNDPCSNECGCLDEVLQIIDKHIEKE